MCDDNHKLPSLKLSCAACGVKMINASEGAVVEYSSALVFFKINGQNIEEVKRIQAPVNYDFVYHIGHYFIGSSKKIIVQNSSHQHVRDINVKEDVGYLAVRDDTTLCYTACWGNMLHCVTMEGTAVFKYSHEKLQKTWGVTVDCAGSIYVCGRESRNIHQLNNDGKLMRIMFDNLPDSPYCISFSKGLDKAAIACSSGVLVYKLS